MDDAAYGSKAIGQFGSFIYLVNQIFGAGILALPFVLHVSGWLPSLLANLLVAVVAMFATLMIMRSMSMIAGNQNFEKRVEYIATVEYFLGPRRRFWTEIAFYLSIQSLNMVSIAVVAQSFDHLLIKLFGKTCGLVFSYNSLSFQVFSDQGMIDQIYDGSSGTLSFVLSLGYLCNALICIPLSSQNMDENMKIQYVSFAFLLTSIFQLSFAAASRIVANNGSGNIVTRPPKMFGYYQYGQLFSTFIASYSYVNVVPSWANEMTPGVKVTNAVYQSTLFAAVVYFTFGHLLATAYPTVHSDNVLQELLMDPNTGIATRFSVYVFNLLTVLPGILVYSITTRYNLQNSGVADARSSYILGCIMPFSVAFLLANDRYFSAVLQWSSLLFSLAVNFIIPSWVYFNACSTIRLAVRNPTRRHNTIHAYTKRTKDGVMEMVDDITFTLKEYLTSLPSDELDPDIKILMQKSPEMKFQSIENNAEESEGWYPEPSLDRHSRSKFHSMTKRHVPQQSTLFDFITNQFSSSTAFRHDDEPMPPRIDHCCSHSNLNSVSYSPLFKHQSACEPLLDEVPFGDDWWKTETQYTSKGEIERDVLEKHCFSLIDSSAELLPSKLASNIRKSKLHIPLLSSNIKCLELLPLGKARSFSPSQPICPSVSTSRCSNSFSRKGQHEDHSVQIRQMHSADFFRGRKNFHFSKQHEFGTRTHSNVGPSQLQEMSLQRVSFEEALDSIVDPMDLVSAPVSSVIAKVGTMKPMKKSNVIGSWAGSHVTHVHNINTPDSPILVPTKRGTPNITITVTEDNEPVTDPYNPVVRLLSLDLSPQDLLEERRSGSFSEPPVNQTSQATLLPSSIEVTLPLGTPHHSYNQHLKPPPVVLKDLPTELPRDMLEPTEAGAEDAYECDEVPATGQLKPIRIHVFPKGPLRTYHLTTARVLLGMLVGFCCLSATSQCIVDVLVKHGYLAKPPSL